jgi:6-phospho-beta-glucosidase
MSTVTLAVAGGSGFATPALALALRRWPAGSRPPLRLVLLGRDGRKLEYVRAACACLLAGSEPAVDVEATTDWRAGLKGADFVLNQVRVGGLEARAYDETFPRALGLVAEETIGAGGFANALRTLPVVLDLCREIAAVAPQAIVLNLTNPAGLVQYAVRRYIGLELISLCDSPISLSEAVAQLLRRPLSSLTVEYFGLNHLGWLVAVRDQEGRDLLDEALERVAELPSPGVDPTYIRATRAIPNPYVRYYLHADRLLREQRERPPRAEQLQELERTLLRLYEQVARQVPDERRQAELAAAVGQRRAIWYEAIVVPLLASLMSEQASRWIVNLPNAGLIPWLPAETIIEGPALVDRQGLHPLPVPHDLLAPDLRLLLIAQATYEQLAAAAIVEGDRLLALRALVAHPLIGSVDLAGQLLARLWPAEGSPSA